MHDSDVSSPCLNLTVSNLGADFENTLRANHGGMRRYICDVAIECVVPRAFSVAALDWHANTFETPAGPGRLPDTPFGASPKSQKHRRRTDLCEPSSTFRVIVRRAHNKTDKNFTFALPHLFDIRTMK